VTTLEQLLEVSDLVKTDPSQGDHMIFGDYLKLWDTVKIHLLKLGNRPIGFCVCVEFPNRVLLDVLLVLQPVL
jgi:hypothetical protein